MTPAEYAIEQLMASPGLARVLRLSDPEPEAIRREIRAALANAIEAGRQLEREQPEITSEAPVREVAIEAARASGINELLDRQLAALGVVEARYAGTAQYQIASEVMAAYGDALMQSVAGR